DRFIKGECPRCHAQDQYGDACEICGATYQPTELINPYSALSGTAPIRKQSDHYFFRLSECEDFLREWTRAGHLQPEAANKLDEWFTAGLKNWDISRDAPYFGFEIPEAPGKYFYVWLDAPIGYMASFKNLCERAGLDFEAYWGPTSKAELYHFIGKDILYFHALFWPALLHYSGYRTPSRIFAHGFLTVNGEKMSKSRGTFITARSYLDHINNPGYLRYYYAFKLNGTMEDIDLNLADFVSRVNADLIGKYINIASRAAGFIIRRFDGELAAPADSPEDARRLIRNSLDAAGPIAENYEGRNCGAVLREVMRIADTVNQYFDRHQPWILEKDPVRKEELQLVCSKSLQAFYVLSIYLAPILPNLTERVARDLFGLDRGLNWHDLDTLPARIRPYRHLITRIDPKTIEALVAANRE
ncbi:MAG: methionine--tRNA ligase, partial [Gammaproteobacteria bacterium]